jgi:hypothetical protein
VFNNDRDTNRVFVEGAETLTYAWNSCPVIGTDLSRSLLTVGQEFKFPIDFVTNRAVNFEQPATSARSFAADLTDLMLTCREVYQLLISEHRAVHREYRNSQPNDPRQFQVGDIVFTNVQVQAKTSSGTVGKLSYIRRGGPYRIIKSFQSGSYELQSVNNSQHVTIKKHGSDLYMCPPELVPH